MLADERPWFAEQRARCESALIDLVCEAILTLREAEAREASEAEQRLEAGTYGYCVDCHRVIAIERLDELPFALRCAECDHAHVAHESHVVLTAS